MTSLLPLLSAVLVASLLGSGHCVGMCGAFVAFAVSPDAGPAGRARLVAAYSLGRLATYSLLGALAGTLGAALDLGGGFLGIQRAALAVAGGLMVLFAAAMLARSLGVRLPHARLPGPLQRAVAALHRAAFLLPPLPRALVIGLLTTLLPCGWLYAFAITAAGTGNPWAGAAVMAVFWGGTVPALATLGLGLGFLAGPLRRRAPAITALLLAAVGLWTLLGRFEVPALAMPPEAASAEEDAIGRVEALDAHRMPCCQASPE